MDAQKEDEKMRNRPCWNLMWTVKDENMANTGKSAGLHLIMINIKYAKSYDMSDSSRCPCNLYLFKG
jgi:hypothetical protein